MGTGLLCAEIDGRIAARDRQRDAAALAEHGGADRGSVRADVIPAGDSAFVHRGTADSAIAGGGVGRRHRFYGASAVAREETGTLWERYLAEPLPCLKWIRLVVPKEAIQ